MTFAELIERQTYALLRTEADIEYARRLGLRLHHEVEVEEDPDEPGTYLVTRDDWYAATNEFVDEYHKNGGTWGYQD